MSAVYHVNPETGNTGVCEARVMCKFGVAYSEHFGSQAEAASAYEFKMEAEFIDVRRNIEVLSEVLRSPDGADDYDVKETVLENIESVDVSEWSETHKNDLLALVKVADFVKRGVTVDSYSDFQHTLKKFKGEDSLSDNLKDTARYLYIQGVADSLPRDVWVPSRKVNEGLINASDSQREVVRIANNAYGYIPSDAYIYEGAERDIDGAIDRVVNGEQYPDIYSTYEHNSLIPKRDRLARLLSTENEAFSGQLYLGTVFPDKELKAAMEKCGVKDVETDTFYNSREWGVVYTVKEPSGDSRSFSVYAYRNSDEIIINGKTNWERGSELPYAGVSKSNYFVASYPDCREEVAEILANYMASAQRGELASDEELASKPIFVTESLRDTNADE